MKLYFAAAAAGFFWICCLEILILFPIRYAAGRLIESSETWIRRMFPKTPGGELAGGGLLAL